MAFYPVLAGGVLIFSRDFFARFVECDRINNEKKNPIAQSIISKLLVSSMPLSLTHQDFMSIRTKQRYTSCVSAQIQIQVNNDESMNHGSGSKGWLRFALQRGSE